jgi:hypothetical protein
VGKETPGLVWPDNELVPTFQPPQQLAIYDLRGAMRDTQLSATVMAGLVNRPVPKVYLVLGDDDAFWLDQALQAIPHQIVPLRGNAALDALLDTYHGAVQGLIIYDPALLDTINVATTLAGQHAGLVVSPNQAQQLQKTYQFPVLFDLRIHHWRTRLQAYQWAHQQLRDDASSHVLAGIDPGALAGLRSFLVATRAFVYWLDSRNYVPDLSAGLLSERSLMQQLIDTYPAGAAHFGWFIDEGSGVNLTSMAAMPVLASDYFNNLEVWTALRMQTVAAHAPLPALPEVANKMYLAFTMSDGDNLQYMQHRLLHLWHDRARGALPIGWTFSPLLWQIAPAMAEYYLRTATDRDELIAGPSGAGYMFPSRWPDAYLASFLQRTGQLMQTLNMTTLEVLDTDFWQRSGLPLASKISLSGMVFASEARQRDVVRALKPYGLQGVLSGSGVLWPRNGLVDGVPLYHNLGIAGSVGSAVQMIRAAALLHSRRPFFLNLYVLAWSMSPTALLQVVQQLGDEYEVVLPATLLAMLARVS